MERVILHADINSCYAQIEEMQYPELREVPMAVGGNEKQRHGIILAKNQMARFRYGDMMTRFTEEDFENF